MENIPPYISIFFGLIILFTVFLFYKATNNSKIFLFLVLGWLIIQSIVSMNCFYTKTDTNPPGFLLLVAPPLIMIAVLFSIHRGRRFLDSLNIQALTILHVIRIPVELMIFILFLLKAVPHLMTFEGRNFDILSGLSAPLVYYFAFVKRQMNIRFLLTWNFICLALLINIVANAVLSAPFSFQKFAFDQPNIAILYFPFVFLPGCIVPLVLLSHLASIRQLIFVMKKVDK